MNCKNCGSQVADDSAFCTECGAKIEKEIPQQSQNIYSAPQGVYDPTPPISMGGFLGMILLFSIPVVNIIMMFVWGFGANENPNRKNYSRAMLIMFAISFVLGIIVLIASMGAILAIVENLPYYY